MSKNNAINNATQDLTIDPGSSGDSWIQFDINTTGEFRVGVDDDDGDSFKISQGSALGTNDTWTMTSAGERTMPLQPAFLSYQASTASNVTGDGTNYTLGSSVALTEVYDQGSDATTAGVFTAPVTGRYLFFAAAYCGDITTSHTQNSFPLIGSNRSVSMWYVNNTPKDVNNEFSIASGTFLDMDSADTATARVTFRNGTKVVDVLGSANMDTFFSGALFC